MTTLTATHVDSRRLDDAMGDVLDATDGPACSGVLAPMDAFMRVSDDDSAPEVDLSACLSRVATLMALGTPTIGEMMSSITQTWVEPRLARGLAALTAELIGAVAAAGPAHARIYVACDWDGDQLVLAVASPDAARHPVPGAAASRSLLRARRLAWTLEGELVRGVRGDMMIHAATFAWRAGTGSGSSSGDRA